MTDFEMRMKDLERRLQALEDRTRRFVWSREVVWSREEERTRRENREKELVDSYGEHVDKKTAAQILGVTRQTVYKMIEDGRINAVYGGKRVDVRSIARFMCSEKTEGQEEKSCR